MYIACVALKIRKSCVQETEPKYNKAVYNSDSAVKVE